MPVGAAPSMHHRAPGPSGAPSSTRRPGGKAPALAPAPAAPPLRIRGPGGSLRARQPTRGGSQRRGGSNEDDEHDDGGESADERVSDEEEFYGAPQRKRPSDRTESLVGELPPLHFGQEVALTVPAKTCSTLSHRGSPLSRRAFSSSKSKRLSTPRSRGRRCRRPCVHASAAEVSSR